MKIEGIHAISALDGLLGLTETYCRIWRDIWRLNNILDKGVGYDITVPITKAIRIVEFSNGGYKIRKKLPMN